MTAIPSIAADHSFRPLAHWFIALVLRHQSSPSGHAGAAPSLVSHATRLALLLSALPPLASVLPLAGPPSRLFDLNHLLATLVGGLGLIGCDPDYPWSEACWPGQSDLDSFALPWRIREEARLATGHYRPVPWADRLPAIADHFAHLSTEKPTLIAFTQSPQKGERDLQTTIKPGRYLARFYPDLPDHEVRDIQSAIRRPAVLKLAVSADEIEEIYVAGPSSCMSKPADDYDSRCHPVRVYGDSDLRLAYVTDDDDHPTARALVWPARMLHGRIYGDEALLTALLAEAGYSRAPLTGARIRRITESDTQVVMPYLDDAHDFEVVDDAWLRIGGPHVADSTCGIADIVDHAICGRCDDRVPSDSLSEVDHEEWCQSCSDHYAFVSDYSCMRFPDTDRVRLVAGRESDRLIVEDWAQSECDDHATWCDGTARHYRTDRFSFVTQPSGETWVDWYHAQRSQNGEDHDPPIAAAGNDNQTAAGDRVAA